MARFAEAAREWGGVALVAVIGAVVVAASVALGIALAIGVLALKGAILAAVAWVCWNFIAPHLDFVPVAQQHIDFLTVWGVIVLLLIVRAVLFGRVKLGKS